ncbi:hypothetical protein DWB84_00560 [Saccharophagus sp. K07]|nr:hypothetical protein [Saccharophagus sp. K07]
MFIAGLGPRAEFSLDTLSFPVLIPMPHLEKNVLSQKNLFKNQELAQSKAREYPRHSKSKTNQKCLMALFTDLFFADSFGITQGCPKIASILIVSYFEYLDAPN